MTAHSLASHCRALHNIVRKSEISLSFCVVVTLSPPFSLILNGYAHSFSAYPHTWAALLKAATVSTSTVHFEYAFWCMLVLQYLCGVGTNIQQGIFKCLCYCVICDSFAQFLHIGNLENYCNNLTLTMQIAFTADSSTVWYLNYTKLFCQCWNKYIWNPPSWIIFFLSARHSAFWDCRQRIQVVLP